MRARERGSFVLLFALLTIVGVSIGSMADVTFQSSVTGTTASGAIPLEVPGPPPNYPTYLGNVQRDSALNFERSAINVTSAAHLHPLWRFASNDTVASQAIVDNGVVYVGSWNGFEYALNASTGALLWKTFLGVVDQDTGPGKCGQVLGVTATATYTKNALYVYGGPSELFALNPTTGSVLWSTSVVRAPAYGYYAWSSPLIFNGMAYVGLSSQCDLPQVPAGLDEISLASHEIVHSLNTSVPNPNGTSIWSSPAVNTSSRTIYITTGNAFGQLSSSYGESIVSLNGTTLVP